MSRFIGCRFRCIPELRWFYRNVKWQPAKPPTRIKVSNVAPGIGLSRTTGLDIPHGIDSIDFRITGTGHDRIERIYEAGCINCRKIIGFNEKQPEHRIADWLCRHACSFVLFDTKARATVIGFERKEDADAFRLEFA